MAMPTQLADPAHTPTAWPVLLLAVAIAGGLGTLARFGLALAIGRCGGWLARPDQPGWSFGLVGGVPGAAPLGTLVVNALGCLLFGLLYGWTTTREGILGFTTPEVRVVVLTGFLGAFTTFSTFAFETTHLLRHGHAAAALLNVLLQNAVGLTLAFVGLTLASRIFGQD